MPHVAEMDAYQCLRWDWGGAYDITRRPEMPHPYRAARRDDPTAVLTADAPEELRELIRADYWAKPIPREIAP